MTSYRKCIQQKSNNFSRSFLAIRYSFREGKNSMFVWTFSFSHPQLDKCTNCFSKSITAVRKRFSSLWYSLRHYYATRNHNKTEPQIRKSPTKQNRRHRLTAYYAYTKCRKISKFHPIAYKPPHTFRNLRSRYFLNKIKRQNNFPHEIEKIESKNKKSIWRNLIVRQEWPRWVERTHALVASGRHSSHPFKGPPQLSLRVIIASLFRVYLSS